MKTKTLTFHNALNYGAALQTYALHRVLTKNYEIENQVINYVSRSLKNNYTFSTFKRKGFKRYVLGIAYQLVRSLRSKKFDSFNSQLKLTEEYTKLDIKNACKDCDVLICGSDQVWNLGLTGEDYNYFLEFAKKDKRVKKISYAASFGNDEIDKYDEIRIKSCLENYSAINVREHEARTLLEKIGLHHCQIVLDPTMLMTASEWRNQMNSQVHFGDNYILLFQVGGSAELLQAAKIASKELGCGIVAIPFPIGGFLRAKINLTAGPAEWLSLVANAKIVFTDSFHGSVFSIIFNRPFRVLAKEGVSRMKTLLSTFEVNWTMIESAQDYDIIKYCDRFDWESINCKLEAERERSLDLLRNSVVS